ncbi:hypothetical protein R3P38DRAFT_3188955 [Favolaschia claudopus]|uniref:Uncharacterized protein n=1 Tax=Favolaschia claudopus TaxID=2862362 RepID=A0AAW0BUY4_9AGAR
MAPKKTWLTPEQKDFVAAWFPVYLHEKAHRRLPAFWSVMLEDWFREFPLRGDVDTEEFKQEVDLQKKVGRINSHTSPPRALPLVYMPPKPWSTPEQDLFISTWFPEFLLKKSQKKLEGFWVKLKEAWFSEFPEELALGLPVQEAHDPNAVTQTRSLTAEERELLNTAMTKRFKQLHDKLYNIFGKLSAQRGGVSRSAHSLASTLFKKYPKRRRRHQVLEVYAREHKAEVQQALDVAGFTDLNEAAMCRDEDGTWVDDNDSDIKKKRIEAARSERMKVYRRVLQESFDGAAFQVQEAMRRLAAEEVVKPGPTSSEEEGEDAERTPEECQLSIDEALGVLDMFFSVFSQMLGGWVGFASCIGPIPRLGGKLGMKTHCFGSTKEGLSFEDFHPNFEKAVGQPLAKFARIVIPREVRLSRALYSLEDEEAIEEDVATAGEQEAPAPSKKSSSRKNRKEKAKEKASKNQKSAKQATPDPNVTNERLGTLQPPARRPRDRRSASSSAAVSTSSISSASTQSAPAFPPTNASESSHTPLSIPAPESFRSTPSVDGLHHPASTALESSHANSLGGVHPSGSTDDLFPPGYDWTRHLPPDGDLASLDNPGLDDESWATNDLAVNDDPGLFALPEPDTQNTTYGVQGFRFPPLTADTPSHSDDIFGSSSSVGMSNTLFPRSRSSFDAAHYDSQVPEHLHIDQMETAHSYSGTAMSTTDPADGLQGDMGMTASGLHSSQPQTQDSSSSNRPLPRRLERSASGSIQFGRTPHFRSFQTTVVPHLGNRSSSAPLLRSSPLAQEPIFGFPRSDSLANPVSTPQPPATSSSPPYTASTSNSTSTSTSSFRPHLAAASFSPGLNSDPLHRFRSTPNANPPTSTTSSSPSPIVSNAASPSNPTPTPTPFTPHPAAASSPPNAAPPILPPNPPTSFTSTPHPPTSSNPTAGTEEPQGVLSLDALPLRMRRISTSPRPAREKQALPFPAKEKEALPFPRSRPQANAPPPPPPDPPSPSTMARRMEHARQAKNGKAAKGGTGKTKVKKGVSAAKPSNAEPVAGFKIRLPARAVAPASQLHLVPEVAAPPVHVFTSTNNNRHAALEAARKEQARTAAAATQSAGGIQVTNPAINNYNTVVVVPNVSRPRRQVVAPANRGEIRTLAERDAELLERLNGGKRRAEAEGELQGVKKKQRTDER